MSADGPRMRRQVWVQYARFSDQGWGPWAPAWYDGENFTDPAGILIARPERWAEFDLPITKWSDARYPTLPIIEVDVHYMPATVVSEADLISSKEKFFLRPHRWLAKRAIDLRWVATAGANKLGHDGWALERRGLKVPDYVDATHIEMCGAGDGGFDIGMSYEEFMPLWLRAKGITC